MRVVVFVRGSILAYAFLLAVLTDETSRVIGSHDNASIDLCHGPVRSRTAIQLSVRAPGETGQLSAGKITEEEWGEYCQRRVSAFPHRRWPREQSPKESSLYQTRRRSNLPLALSVPSFASPEPFGRHAHAGGPAWRAAVRLGAGGPARPIPKGKRADVEVRIETVTGRKHKGEAGSLPSG